MNGTKTFITGGTLADYLLVLLCDRTSGQVRHDRFSVIMVETDRKGFEAPSLNTSLASVPRTQLKSLSAIVRVPKANLIGTPGRGFQQFYGVLRSHRLHVAAEAVGLAQGAMEQAIQHVRKRQQFGKPLASFQVTQFKIAENGHTN